MAEDALNAKKMNVGIGGKQAVMRPGWYIRNGLRSVYSYISNQKMLI